MTCKPYDVVVVPFPFTDRRTSNRRPALALSSETFSAESGHTVLAMITSARRKRQRTPKQSAGMDVNSAVAA